MCAAHLCLASLRAYAFLALHALPCIHLARSIDLLHVASSPLMSYAFERLMYMVIPALYLIWCNFWTSAGG